MSDARHSNQAPAQGIHVVHDYVFANATDRLAFANEVNGKPTPTAADIGKVARQIDDGTFHVLNDESPITWEKIGTLLTSSTPLAIEPDDTGLVGTSTEAARADHRHANVAGTPGTITIGASAAEGTATSFSRSDHVHALAAPAAPANVTKAAASAGSATATARADHKHDITTAAAVAVGTANAEGTATSLARSDHTHQVTGLTVAGQVQGDVLYFNGTSWVRLAPGTSGQFLKTLGAAANPAWDAAAQVTSTAPLDVTKAAAAVGVSTEAARADHKHDVTTAAPTATLSHASTNTEGTATTLARSDHTHAFGVPAAPANVTKAAASAGTATAFARADHKHDITTAAAVAVGTANAEGVATSLARSDHTHQVTGLTISGQVQGDVLYYNGTSWVRLAPGTSGQFLKTLGAAANPIWDSAAALTSSAPENVTKSAAVVGVSTTAARSDHKHDITTAAAVANQPGTASAEGVATSLARSDHTHALNAYGTGASTICQGNDSRLTNDRTASGIRTATTVVVVSAATAPTSGQVLTASSGVLAAWSTPAAGSGGSSPQFYADQMDLPVNSDWGVNALAPAAADNLNAGLTEREMDDLTEEGAGWIHRTPTSATNIVLHMVAHAKTAPPGVRTAGLTLRNRGIKNGAAVEAWTSLVLTDLSIPADNFHHYFSQSIPFATIGLTVDEVTQFELTRTQPVGGTELAGILNWLLEEIRYT